MPFIDASEMVKRSPVAGWSGRFFHSETMTFAHWDIAAGAADLHEHHHPEEEVWNVVDGEVVLIIDDHERHLGPGDAAVVPPNTRHSAKPVGPCRAVIVDHPVRLQLPGTHSPRPR